MFFLVVFCSLIGLIHGNICPTNVTNIYAADNLSNGTVRIYSGYKYWDLILIQNDADNWNTSNFILEANFSLSLYASLEQHGWTNETFSGLTFEIVDNDTVQTSMVSLNLFNEGEYTFLFQTEYFPNYTYMVVIYYWHLQHGMLVNRSELESTPSSKSLLQITSLFHVYLNGSEHMLAIVNNKLFWTEVNVNGNGKLNRSIILKQNQKMQTGSIPEGVTATFLIQPEEDLIWLCLIKCNFYCLAPFNGNSFLFDQCNTDSGNWISIEKWFQINASTTNLTSNFRNVITSISIDSFESSSANSLKDYFMNRSFNIFNYKVSGKKIARFFVLCLVFSYFLITIAIWLKFRDHSYDVADAEERNARRMKKDAGEIVAPNDEEPVESKLVEVIGDEGDGENLSTK